MLKRFRIQTISNSEIFKHSPLQIISLLGRILVRLQKDLQLFPVTADGVKETMKLF